MRNRQVFACVVVIGAMWLFGLTGCVGFGGEKIKIAHCNLEVPTQQFSEQLHVSSPAVDLREEKDGVGRATITVFAITSGGVTTTGALGEEVAREVKEALEASGYRVELLRQGIVKTGVDTLVKVSIKECWFKNYNWFWPIVRTWEDVEIGLTVENATGQSVFERSFKGSGSSMCLSGECAFETAISEAMTEVVKQIREMAVSEEFRRAIRKI